MDSYWYILSMKGGCFPSKLFIKVHNVSDYIYFLFQSNTATRTYKKTQIIFLNIAKTSFNVFL